MAGLSGAGAAALFLLGRWSAQHEAPAAKAPAAREPQRSFWRPPPQASVGSRKVLEALWQVNSSIEEKHLVSFVRQLPSKPLVSGPSEL